MSRRVGAPDGGRVHWLLHNLTPEFKGKYTLLYNYNRHNYTFVRYRGRKLYEIFIVMRTSIHSWRCVYYNDEYKAFERCHTRKSDDMARCLMLISQAYNLE